MSVPELLDLQLTQSPAHPVYVYDDPDGEIVTIRMEQYVRTVHEAAKLVHRHVQAVCDPALDSPIVIGLFAATLVCSLRFYVATASADLSIDSISYCMMMNAVVRAGHIPFAISTRNNPTNLVHLFSVTDTVIVYTSPDSQTQNIVASSTEKLSEINGRVISSFPFPKFDDFQHNLDKATLLPPLSPPSMSSVAVILHSSGEI